MSTSSTSDWSPLHHFHLYHLRLRHFFLIRLEYEFLRTVIRFCPNLSSHSISIKGRLTPVFWSSFVIVSNLCSARIFSWLKCQRFKPFYKIMSDFGRICSQSVFKSWVKLSFLTAYSLGSLMLTFLQGAPRIALWSKTGHIKWL